MKPQKPKREPKQRRQPADENDEPDFETPAKSIPKPHELPGLQPPTVLRLR